MRYIGINDTNETPIFEGDTLEITNPDEFYFDDSYIKACNIDRITFDVIPLDGEVGVELHCHFWSNNQAITYQSEFDYFSKTMSQDELKNYFKDRPLDEKAQYKIQSWHNIMFIFQGFKHAKSKRIIKHSVPLEGRECLINAVKPSDLTVTVDGVKHCAATTRFLVELTPSALEIAMKAHCDPQDELIMEGGFTHILLKPKKCSLFEYDFDPEPVDKDGNHTWLEVYNCSEKWRQLVKPINQKWKDEIAQWENDNQHLTEEEREEYISASRKVRFDKISQLRTSKETETKAPCTFLFLGLNVSKNLFKFFADHNCTVKPI